MNELPARHFPDVFTDLIGRHALKQRSEKNYSTRLQTALPFPAPPPAGTASAFVMFFEPAARKKAAGGAIMLPSTPQRTLFDAR